jgi:hypothetical protein
MLTMVKNFTKNFLLYLLIINIVLPHLTYAGYLLEVRPISISAVVVDPNVVIHPGGGGNTGGGGGGGSGIYLPTTVNFSGMAYPNSKVTILKNNTVAATTVVDPNAKFLISLNNLDTGTYNFSIYGEDNIGTKSLTFSFPVYVTSGTTVNISGIFLSPTINIDKSEVKRGDDLIVFGQTTPNTDLSIVFHSDVEILRNIKTNITGLYEYTMDTTPLDFGEHHVKSKAIMDSEVKATSIEVPFVVGFANKLIDYTNKCGTIRGDLNCDGRVNLTDFSIMAYWYKKSNPPTNIDLNNDGNISLVDFSIMAYSWTG